MTSVNYIVHSTGKASIINMMSSKMDECEYVTEVKQSSHTEVCNIKVLKWMYNAQMNARKNDIFPNY